MDFESSSHRRHWLFAPEHLAEVRVRAHKEALRKVILAHHISSKPNDGNSDGGNGMEARSSNSLATSNDQGAVASLESSGSDSKDIGGARVPTSLVVDAPSSKDALLPANPLGLFEERLLLVKALSKLYHVAKNPGSFRSPVHPRVLTCALSLTQRFFVLQSVMQHDPMCVAATALFLSGKVEERYIDRHSVANAFDIDEIELSQMEPFLLGGVHFDINIFSPFPVVSALVKTFEEMMKEESEVNLLCLQIMEYTISPFQSYLRANSELGDSSEVQGDDGSLLILPPKYSTQYSRAIEDSSSSSSSSSMSSNSTDSLLIAGASGSNSGPADSPPPQVSDFWRYIVESTRSLLERMYLTDAIFLMTPAQLAYGALVQCTERIGKDYIQFKQSEAQSTNATKKLILEHGGNAVWLHSYLMSPLSLPEESSSETQEDQFDQEDQGNAGANAGVGVGAGAGQSPNQASSTTLSHNAGLNMLCNRVLPSISTAIEQGKALIESHSKVFSNSSALENLATRAGLLRTTYLASLRDGEVKQILLADTKRSSRFAEIARRRKEEEDRLLIGTPAGPSTKTSSLSSASALVSSGFNRGGIGGVVHGSGGGDDDHDDHRSVQSESTPMFLHRGDLSRFDSVTPSPNVSMGLGGKGVSGSATSVASSVDIGLRRGRLAMETPGSSIMSANDRSSRHEDGIGIGNGNGNEIELGDDQSNESLSAQQKLKRVRDESSMSISPSS